MRALPILAVALSVSSPAFAGGFYVGDIGSRGMARGGALIAAPDDLLAIHYNPAGLSLLKGFHLRADFTVSTYQMTFERSCPCLPEGAPDREMRDAELQALFDDNPTKTNVPLFIPFLGVGYGIEFLDITVALALWGPTSGRHQYGDLPAGNLPSFPSRAVEQPGRYSGLDMDTLEANIALGVSLSPFDGLRIGATAMLFQNGNDQTLHLWANLPTLVDGAEDPNFDIPVLFSFKENVALNWSVGASYDVPFVPGRLSIGTSFRGKRDIRTGGTIDITLPDKLGRAEPGSDPAAVITGDQVTVELSTAPIFRAGIQYAWPKLFAAEVAWVWEGWSYHDTVVLRPQNIQIAVLGGDPVPLEKIEADRFWQDTWSLRFGAEIELFEPYLGISAGYFYEPTGIPLERLDPSRVDLDKHGFGAGLSTTWYGVTLQLGFTFVALSAAEVTNSVVDITAPDLRNSNGDLISDPQLNTIIGNGKYSGNLFMTTLSLSFALDPLLTEISEEEAKEQ